MNSSHLDPLHDDWYSTEDQTSPSSLPQASHVTPTGHMTMGIGPMNGPLGIIFHE